MMRLEPDDLETAQRLQEPIGDGGIGEAAAGGEEREGGRADPPQVRHGPSDRDERLQVYRGGGGAQVGEGRGVAGESLARSFFCHADARLPVELLEIEERETAPVEAERVEGPDDPGDGNANGPGLGQSAHAADEGGPEQRLDEDQPSRFRRPPDGELRPDVGTEAMPGDHRLAVALGAEDRREIVAPDTHVEPPSVEREAVAAKVETQEIPRLAE